MIRSEDLPLTISLFKTITPDPDHSFCNKEPTLKKDVIKNTKFVVNLRSFSKKKEVKRSGKI